MHFPIEPGWTTRFAPAPTGWLHLGHVANAAYVWGLARAFGGRVLLRVEDHDRTRCRAEYEAGLLDDLDWLGFAPDDGGTDDFRRGPHPRRQSDAGARYERALAALAACGRAYACDCSRKAIAELARVAPGEEPRYPGTCRTRNLDPASMPARRIALGDDTVRFDDMRLGPQVQRPAEQSGDVLARDRLGHWTYQFAVTVDDLEQGVDVIIRGEDLLESTGRQFLLARLLGRTTMPRVLHHPLLRKPNGEKLSKSAGDTGVRDLRAAGLSAGQVIGRAVHLAGLTPTERPVAVDDLPSLFR